MYEIDWNKTHRELFAMETERLRLSVLKKNCAPMVTDYFVRNKEFHQQWSQTHSDSYFELKTQKKYLSYDEAEYRQGKIVPLWIMKKYRGRGYAQEAIKAVEAIYGQDNWCLDTILQEEGNLHLYEKMGYIRTGKTEKINDRMDIVFFEKD